MHIALFFTYEISVKDWLTSGLLSREIELYKQISNNTEIQFTFITYGTKEDIEILSEFKKIKVVVVGEYLKSKNKFVKFIQSLTIPFRLKKELKNIDLIKTNQLMGSWIPIILKLLLKKPLIVRTGYDLLEFSIKEKKSIFKIIFYYFLTLLSLIISDKYFVTSKKDLATLNKKFWFLNCKNIEIRQNWVNLPTEPITLKNRKKNAVLMVGRLERQKNYFNVIDNLSGSKLTLDIIGAGSLRKSIEDFAKLNNVNVNFLGTFDHTSLIKKYTQYKYYLLYSKFEGNPKTLLEAMSQGCVPLVLKNENIIEIIKNGINGIILQDEQDSIYEWVLNLNNNSNLFKEISKNAQLLIHEAFSLENYKKREIEDYYNLTNK